MDPEKNGKNDRFRVHMHWVHQWPGEDPLDGDEASLLEFLTTAIGMMLAEEESQHLERLEGLVGTAEEYPEALALIMNAYHKHGGCTKQ